MEVTIRRADESDTADIAALLEEFHNQSPYKAIDTNPADISNWVRSALGEMGIAQVATHKDEVVGVVLGLVHPYPGNLKAMLATEYALYLQEPYRKSGAGKALMGKFEQVAKQKGARLVMLGALGNNFEGPAKLYARSGYTLAEAHFVKDVS